MWLNDADLARELDEARHARELLDPVATGERGVSARAARDEVHALE